MDIVGRGRATSYWNDIIAPRMPWFRASRRDDARNFPGRGGGRELRHPYLPRIPYPRTPDKTFEFGYDVTTHVRTVKVKTLDSSAINKFKDQLEDIVIREVWLAQSLSTLTSFFHALRAYHTLTLPPLRYVGWIPRDLTHKCYFVEILDVQLGGAEEYMVEEIGKTPFMMRESLAISFKPIRELFAPSGVVIGEGL